MKVKVEHLKEGYILMEDIYGMTRKVIVPKNTVITNEIIEVLKAFLIKEVDAVENENKKSLDTINRENQRKLKKETKEPAKENSPTMPKNPQEQDQIVSFIDEYLNAVQIYKKEFQNWSNGLPVNIHTIRQFLIPLFENLIKSPANLLILQNYVRKEDYIYHHSVSVGLITGYIAHKMKMSKGDCYQIALAGCLSDCGMSKIDPKILLKKDLTEAEFGEIKRHTTYSYKMVQNTPSLNTGAKISILQHHERLDGSGYPLGEKNNIHLYAKIIAIADVYHAMICNRVYKDKVSPFKAIETMIHDLVGKFDIAILQTFTSCITQYSINSFVKLSNDKIGKILFIDPKNLTRPIIKLLDNDEVISLSKNKDLFIKEIIHEY